jgi:hypothetical protein
VEEAATKGDEAPHDPESDESAPTPGSSVAGADLPVTGEASEESGEQDAGDSDAS